MLRTGRRADAKLIVLALILTAFTLAYPFGRDQGLFDVIGREWFLRGAVPYRDLVEQKPPPIFVIHGVLIWLFGDQTWAIRAFDLTLTLVAGVALAVLAVPRRTPVPSGLAGFGAFALAVLHYFYFDFWHTAQVDWMATSVAIVAMAGVVRVKRALSAALIAGLGVGTAMLIKPSVVPFALLVVGMFGRRILSDGASIKQCIALGALSVGMALVPWALTLRWFAKHEALDDFVLWVIRVNAYYVKHERATTGLIATTRALIERLAMLQPFPAVLAVLVGVRVIVLPRFKRGQHGMYNLALLLIGAAFVTLVSQMKFYAYHAAPLLFGSVHLGLVLLCDFANALESTRGTSFGRSVEVATIAVIVGAATARTEVPVFALYSGTLRHLAGDLDAGWFSRYFDLPGLAFASEDSYIIAMEVRRRARVGDRLSVRGFEPQIYSLAGLPPGSRFFWTNFITDPRRSMLHDVWLEEESRSLRNHPPRFVVTLRDTGEVIGTDWQQARAPYAKVFQSGQLRLLELQQP